jgi:hypothetical protein
MKGAYAVRRTVPPLAEIQASLDKLLAKGMVNDPQKMLSELARLGARLIIQRAVEEEFDTWLGRGRYERRPERQRGLRNGFRSRRVQTGEGELRIEIPQAREAAVPFVSKLFPKWHCKRLLRTDPLKALVIGVFVRGLSMRDIESLREEAALGKTSRSTVARICAGLRRSRRVSPPRPWRASATCYAPPPRICRRPISPSRSGSAAPRHSATWRNFARGGQIELHLHYGATGRAEHQYRMPAQS